MQLVAPESQSDCIACAYKCHNDLNKHLSPLNTNIAIVRLLHYV